MRKVIKQLPVSVYEEDWRILKSEFTLEEYKKLLTTLKANVKAAIEEHNNAKIS